MSAALRAFLRRELSVPLRAEIRAAAEALARRHDARAILFYGSVLRTGDLDGLLDFYVLTDGVPGNGLRAMATRLLWPDISYAEISVNGRPIRAKVATMPLETFHAAAQGRYLDTTIWTRFTQPVALAWSASDAAAARTVDAIVEAVTTAARFAAVLGPMSGKPADYWTALFRETYTTEFRVERPGREQQILAYDPDRYDTLLPEAWKAAGIRYSRAASGILAPHPSSALCQGAVEAWLLRRRVGKMLNIARLLKAAFTFDGAARYALWKLERHTGVSLPLTPWRERHPILAAPGTLWQVWRTSRVAPA